METNLIEILKTLGIFSIGSFTLVGLLGYLAKRIFENYLKQRLADYNNELALQKERIKIEFDFIKYRNQISYTKLYEERANLFKELFIKLILIKEKFNNAINIDKNPDSTDIKKVEDEIKDIKNIISLNRIYLDSIVITKLNKIFELMNDLKILNNEVIDTKIVLQESLMENKPYNSNNTSFKELRMKEKEINDEIENVILKIELDFKKTLGFDEITNHNNVYKK